MPVMNFDLEDGKPPVSFSLKPDDAARFMDFLAECEQIKNSAAPADDTLMDAARWRAVLCNTHLQGSRNGYPTFKQAVDACIVRGDPKKSIVVSFEECMK